uniref:Uncharacterized protein n=1 Tax=Plectus sambesii TaxID=2011161 RepID=A0A914VRB8_9BILA
MTTLSSLLAQIQKAKSSLQNVETKVITPDGRELIEQRDNDGFTKATQVAVRPWGFVGDFRPDLQMAEVAPGLYLGGQDPAHDADLLSSKSITHIVNLATNVDNHFPSRFVYMKIDIYDLPSCDIACFIPDCLSFIRAAILKGGRVFCHCNAGVSRSASMVIAYLMRYEGLRYSVAHERVKSIRAVIRPNEGFVRQLKTYEVDLDFERGVSANGKLH